MSPPMRITGLVALLSAAMLAPVQSAEPKLPREGWVSWQVPATEGAPNWCCWSDWQRPNATRTTCQLEGSAQGFNISGRDDTTETLTVYARVTAGRLDRVQALSASCPVEAKTPVQALGDVTTDDSARWLIAQVKQSGADGPTRRSLGENALAALAMHHGDVASKALTDFARHDAALETRKRAVFWLAMLRGPEGAEITSSVMFGDKHSEVRKHAAFALTQSSSPRIAAELTRLGNTDKVGDVRAEAWFWLAQTGLPEVERAITAALKQDADEDVRERAVFALSQLPEERGPRALIAVAEDRSLTREHRKRAVFWLSQSESDLAQAYLDKVLTSAVN